MARRFCRVFLEGQGSSSGDEDHMARIVTCHDPYMLYSNNGVSDACRFLAEVWSHREDLR